MASGSVTSGRVSSGSVTSGSVTSGSVPSSSFAGESKPTRKLSEREEAMVQLSGHFQELAVLLRGVHTRMDDKLGRLVEAASTMQQLPQLHSQQLELMRAVAAHLEKQNLVGEQIAKSVHGLPEMMGKVESALQRAAQTDERTSATMREFQGTMDRIQSAMGSMVESSEKQSRATQQLASQRQESLQEAMTELRTTASDSLESLRRTHEDQSNRLQRVVQEHAGWNKAVLAVLGIVVVGMVGLLVMQLVK